MVRREVICTRWPRLRSYLKCESRVHFLEPSKSREQLILTMIVQYLLLCIVSQVTTTLTWNAIHTAIQIRRDTRTCVMMSMVFMGLFVVWGVPLRAVLTSNVVYDIACVCTLLAPIGETRFRGGGATSGHPSSFFMYFINGIGD